MSGKLDLNVDSPDKVARVLHEAASSFAEAASELSAAWQDSSVGRPWDKIARILERAANQVEIMLEKEGY